MSLPLPFDSLAASAKAALAAAQAARRIGDHVAGVARSTEAFQLALAIGDTRLQASALALLALHQWRLGDAEAAVAHAQQALPLLQREHEDAEERAELLCTMAMAYNDLGLNSDALAQVMLALDAAKLSGRPSLVSWAMNRIGVTYEELDELEEGQHFLAEALDIARRIEGAEETFSALNNLASNHAHAAERAATVGDAASRARHAEQSVRHGREALALAEASGNTHREATCHSNLSHAHLHLDQFGLAAAHAERCRAVADAGRYRSLQLSATILHAQVRCAQGDWQAAVRCYEGALVDAAELDDRRTALRLHAELHALYKRHGLLAEALAHHEALLALERALMKQRADTRTRLLISRMDLELARSEAERSRLDAEVQRLRAKQLEDEMRQLALQAHELGRRALEDQLTGLANRRRVDEELPQQLALARERHSPLCIAVLDLDHFKVINDRHGHTMGDDVLRTLARVLLGHTRGTDVLARIGGEEFLVLFAGTPLEVAASVCERLRAAVECYDWASLAPGLAVTLSIGLCDAHDALDVRHAIERADAALYTAKRGGRNRVQLAR